jgi:hypothetical protein
MLLGVEGVSLDHTMGKENVNLSHCLGYDNKILTSARNGELIMWDLIKLGPSKYGEPTCMAELLVLRVDTFA